MRRVIVKMTNLIVGASAGIASIAAAAGPTAPLGTPLGRSLGLALGGGVPLVADLPTGSVLLAVAAVSLVAGIFIVRRKKHR
jgi:hypothetical protein